MSPYWQGFKRSLVTYTRIPLKVDWNYGQNWYEADALAQEALAQEEDAFYIPPYGEASNMSLSHSVTYALTLNYN